MKKIIALLLSLVLALGFTLGAVAEQDETDSEWVNFLLICNEGMNNSQGNAGNTLMVVAMNPSTGKIRLVMFTWDTFIDYPGYDVPQKLDMPYRNNGPEEAMSVFNQNFGTDINLYMSLNYLNLASLIDTYGGVTIDITRAERNALNGMVGSKKEKLQDQASDGTMSQQTLDMLSQEYYLNDYGEDIELNGLQAVGYGWLQYDSVYNCCRRELAVVANLFESVFKTANSKVVFYTDDSGYPTDTEGKRAVNIDNVTDDDYLFLLQLISPIFQMTFNNLDDESIRSIAISLMRVAYEANRNGVDIFDSIETLILPLEAQDDYDIIAGAQGHLIDKEANAKAMTDFLYNED